MQILRSLHSSDIHPCAVTIGNFDGVHRGHQSLLRELQQAAQARGLLTAVVTFEPHPREFFTPQQAPVRLTSLREKLELLRAAGIDRVHVCRFNTMFARKTADEFIHALHDDLRAKYVLIGDDFRFGSGRSGDFSLMQQIGAQRGFEVAAVHSVLHDGVSPARPFVPPCRRESWTWRATIWGDRTASAGAWCTATAWDASSAFPPRTCR